jgi:hypothetical protein
MLAEREALLERQRSILRQAGDTIAWLLIDEGPQILARLYKPSSHYLPTGVGLIGVAETTRRLNESGRFLALENDLTRAIGIGDITVVRTTPPGYRPIQMEMKSSGEVRLGATIQIDSIAAFSDSPEDLALFEDIQTVLGHHDSPRQARGDREARQTEELIRRAQLVVRLQGSMLTSIKPPSRATWHLFGNVLERALADGAAYDSREQGVAYLGIRCRPGDKPIEAMQDIVGGLEWLGLPLGLPSITSEEFQSSDWWAALVPPIPMWRVSLPIRTSLLSGELFFAVVFTQDAFTGALSDNGITVAAAPTGLLFVRGSESAILPALDVQRFFLGIAFGGVSPKEAARSIAELLSS